MAKKVKKKDNKKLRFVLLTELLDAERHNDTSHSIPSEHDASLFKASNKSKKRINVNKLKPSKKRIMKSDIKSVELLIPEHSRNVPDIANFITDHVSLIEHNVDTEPFLSLSPMISLSLSYDKFITNYKDPVISLGLIKIIVENDKYNIFVIQ